MMRKQRQDQDGPVPLIEGAEVARRLAKQWVHEAELPPLSVLSLDYPEPIGGWETMLEARGIELLTDDLHRLSIAREDARALVEERRQWESQSAEKARRRQESLEALPVPAGIPALEHGSALESLMANDPGYQTAAEEFGRIPKPNFLAEALEAGARQQAAAQAEAESKKAAREKDG
jgi:hypothetical protein